MDKEYTALRYNFKIGYVCFETGWFIERYKKNYEKRHIRTIFVSEEEYIIYLIKFWFRVFVRTIRNKKYSYVLK